MPNAEITASAQSVDVTLAAGAFNAGIENGTLALFLDETTGEAALAASGTAFFSVAGFANVFVQTATIGFNLMLRRPTASSLRLRMAPRSGGPWSTPT